MKMKRMSTINEEIKKSVLLFNVLQIVSSFIKHVYVQKVTLGLKIFGYLLDNLNTNSGCPAQVLVVLGERITQILNPVHN